jgi:RNA polymerase sigma-70 factor (sigma-E family)
VRGSIEFAAFATTRWARLVRAARLMGCSESDAEDMVQSTFERLLVNWRKVERAGNPDAYVHRALANTLMSSRRRRWHGERATEGSNLESLSGNAPDPTGPADRAMLVHGALRGLPAGQRAVIVLRFYLGLTEREAADALRVPIGTIKSRQSRALRALAIDPHLQTMRTE